MTNRIPIPMSAAGDLPARYASISEVLQIAAAAEHAANRIEELEKQLVASEKQIRELQNEIENLEYEMREMGAWS
jgi:TolA-binding protein